MPLSITFWLKQRDCGLEQSLDFSLNCPGVLKNGFHIWLLSAKLVGGDGLVWVFFGPKTSSHTKKLSNNKIATTGRKRHFCLR